jgi:hypothetical protein
VLILLVHVVAYQGAPFPAGGTGREPRVSADLIVNAVVIFISMIALYDRMANRKIFETAHRWLGPKERGQGGESTAQSPQQTA